MIQKSSTYRILQEFFDNPTRNFQMREISRRTQIAQPSVTRHLKALAEEGLIVKEKKGIYPSFRANRDSDAFRICKKLDALERLYFSGVVSVIYDSCLPASIVLFGSASRGEDIEGSDMDIFIQSKEKKLGLEKYEKLFGRKISLFFEENFSRLSNELKNNILNGIILKGYIKIF